MKIVDGKKIGRRRGGRSWRLRKKLGKLKDALAAGETIVITGLPLRVPDDPTVTASKNTPEQSQGSKGPSFDNGGSHCFKIESCQPKKLEAQLPDMMKSCSLKKEKEKWELDRLKEVESDRSEEKQRERAAVWIRDHFYGKAQKE